MRAIQVLTTTGPADIVVTDIPEPVAGPGQVLVEVHAVGVSFP
ncbi:NADPH:quinone oxidoreductase family protein, partial [Nocardioides caeni]